MILKVSEIIRMQSNLIYVISPAINFHSLQIKRLAVFFISPKYFSTLRKYLIILLSK